VSWGGRLCGDAELTKVMGLGVVVVVVVYVLGWLGRAEHFGGLRLRFLQQEGWLRQEGR